MRADRLVATLLLLQHRGRATAAEIARELEVSVATARRDLEALAGAGVPVYPQPGRGGGWALVGGARTDLSGLSEPEARALFLLLGPAASSSDRAQTALRKLLRALPSTFRADAETAARSVVVDRARWGARDRIRPPTVDLFQHAVVDRRKVRLVYEGRGGRSERLVHPWGLVDKDEVWYLVAGTARGRRTFRVDRVVDLEVTDEPADRPDEVALGEVWRDVVDEVEARRSRTWATVLVDPRHVYVLQDQFGRHCRPEGVGEGGRARVAVGAPTALDVARHLAGWGAQLEVVEGEEVRAQLARLGAELVGLYGG